MTILLVVAAAASLWGWVPPQSPQQEGAPPISRPSQPIPFGHPEGPGSPEFPFNPADRSADLWYGTPGVRPGGDLIGPLIDLVRKPSGLLDFGPRRIRPWLPDRETSEFLRERR